MARTTQPRTAVRIPLELLKRIDALMASGLKLPRKSFARKQASRHSIILEALELGARELERRRDEQQSERAA